MLIRMHIFAHSYAKGVEQTWKPTWTYTKVLMHVHILTNEKNQKWDDGTCTWDHTRVHKFMCNCERG